MQILVSQSNYHYNIVMTQRCSFRIPRKEEHRKLSYNLSFASTAYTGSSISLNNPNVIQCHALTAMYSLLNAIALLALIKVSKKTNY